MRSTHPSMNIFVQTKGLTVPPIIYAGLGAT